MTIQKIQNYNEYIKLVNTKTEIKIKVKKETRNDKH